MKVAILYVVIILLSAVIVHISDEMDKRPFTATDMGISYSAGCNIGLHNAPVNKCEQISRMYIQTLMELMEQ